MPADDILSHTHTHIITNTHPDSYKNNVLPRVYYSCHLLISSYYMSCQQYFDILNYKKLENYCHKKKKNK